MKYKVCSELKIQLSKNEDEAVTTVIDLLDHLLNNDGADGVLVKKFIMRYGNTNEVDDIYDIIWYLERFQDAVHNAKNDYGEDSDEDEYYEDEDEEEEY